MKKGFLSIILTLTVLLVFQAVPVFGTETGALPSGLTYQCAETAAAKDSSGSAPAATAEDTPQTVCTSDILIDAKSGEVLYAKNENAKLRPASMTKMMTCLLAIEHYKDLDREVTVTKEAVGVGGNGMDLKEGEVLTVRQLLYALMLHSCNDAAVCIAVDCSGSVPAFCDEMNARAKEIGADDTHFINPNGLTESAEHITTASDMAKIARECMRNRTFRKIVRTKKYVIPATNMSPRRVMKTTNRLLSGSSFKVSVNGQTRSAQYDGAEGIKTGLMPGAKYCFCGAAKRGGVELITVTMHGAADQDRFADTISMLDYGFANYHTVTLYKEGEQCGHVWVKGGHRTRVAVNAKDGAFATLTASESDDLAETKVTLKKNLKAPLKKGDTVGTISIYKDGKKTGTAPVVLSEDVTEGGPWTQLYISDPMFILIVIVLALLIILRLTVIKRRRRRRAELAEKRRKDREKKAMEIALQRRKERERRDERDWPF
ncbi:MAG: D-alanyl-D-alanine carboxypeptidase family protein [Anaerovoracaceae bacterium]|nr:D-alanyl-D-alanine carboxypeptidase family protein [Anaerovoracaceae bacterium]